MRANDIHRITTPYDFIYPFSEPYSPLLTWIMGGVDLGDGSLGRSVYRYVVAYEDELNRIAVYKEELGVVLSISIPESVAVTAVSLAFDANMSPMVAYMTDAGVGYYYYYDTLTEEFVTSSIVGCSSIRCGVDDYRDVGSAFSDIIVCYIKDNKLYYRRQRDRYSVDYLVGDTPNNAVIMQAAPTTKYRFQVMVGKPPLTL